MRLTALKLVYALKALAMRLGIFPSVAKLAGQTASSYKARVTLNFHLWSDRCVIVDPIRFSGVVREPR